ncbi:MAG: D-alanyl-D-alanine carboxypeptidase [Actinobacteria bacterium]|nr:D-alanyl-D-alanine carboxypeptidase [Actinomycetota bacterium]
MAVATVAPATLVSASATPLQSIAAIAKTFERISESASLADPSIILIDRGSGEVIFEKDPMSPRKPASVLKLLSAALALQNLDPNFRYDTTISLGPTPRSLVVVGAFDPWMASRHVDAVANKRASLTSLGNKAIEWMIPLEGGVPRTISVKYNGLYLADINALGTYFKSRNIKAYFTAVNAEQAKELSIEKIATVLSPTVKAMVEYSLRWSDNLLADRLVEAGAVANGYPRNIAGVSAALREFLTEQGIDSTGLSVKDGSGLSKQNRVTAQMIADLLIRIRDNDLFAPIYAGLPVSGVSGTLQDRFIETSPYAVGLVHAKTGTLDGTVSLAGYVSAGDDEYIFVAFADRIKKGSTSTRNARTTLDRLVGKLAFPATANL